MQLHSHSFHALGGPCSLRLYGDDERQCLAASQQAEAEIRRIETKYSRYREDSIVSRINASAGSAIEVDAETAGLLDYAATAYESSDGLFDITSGVLRRAWDFRARRIPTQDQLEPLLKLVGWQRVQWRGRRLRLTVPGMELDFGGFGKEYAADRAADVLRAHGVRHGLVDLAGDLVVLGPHPDGAPWRVGIQHPRASDRALAVVDIEAGGVASSGDYERYIEHEGQRYCHILDPRTGWPVRELSAVSVLAQRCLIAGTAATVAMLKGNHGKRWLDELGLPWIAVDQQRHVAGSIEASHSATVDHFARDVMSAAGNVLRAGAPS